MAIDGRIARLLRSAGGTALTAMLAVAVASPAAAQDDSALSAAPNPFALVGRADIAADRHQKAAQRCDRAAMADQIAVLEGLHREAIELARAARAAGEFATVDARGAEVIANQVALYLVDARARPAVNCPREIIDRPVVAPVGSREPSADVGGTGRRASLFDLGIYGGGAWSQDWFEPTGIGFQRDGPPGNAPERFAAKFSERVESSGAEFGGFFYIPGTDTMLRIGGYVRTGDARTDFDIPGNSGIDSGIVYGELSPGGSSGIATPFGLTGWTELEFDAWSVRLTKSLVSSPRTSKTFDIPPPHTAGLNLSLYGSHGSWNRDYRAMADYSGASGGYTFAFSQMRDQQVDDSFYELGFEGNLAVPVLSGTVFHLNGRAGGYYHDGDLDSFEHNLSNFGPMADRDFTVAIQDSNNGWGFHGEAAATVELVMSPGASLYFGAAAEYRSRVGAIFNPNSGDQVFFDGLTTELRTADTHGWRGFAGIRLRF